MEERSADNKIFESKKMLNNVVNQLDDKKSSLKSLDYVQDEYVSLNKSISKCVDLLRQSIKGGNIDKILDSISMDNNRSLLKATDELEENRDNLKNDIKNLNYKKEDIERELKEEYKKENEKE